MKKMVSLMLAVILVLTSVSCFAAAPEATAHSVQKNVFIEGKVDAYVEGAVLALTLTVGDEVVYVNEYDTVDINDGSYTIKFKHIGDLNGANINVKYADEDVTSSVVDVTVTSQIMEADVFVTDANDRSYEYNIDQTIPPLKFNEWSIKDKDENILHTFEAKEYNSIYSIDERTGLKAVVNIKNKYAYEEEVSIMVAAYDANNKLLDCKIEKLTTEYAVDGKIQSGETVAISVPDGTDKAKAFCWSSTSNLIPFGEQADGELPKVDVFLIGDSYGETYGINYYPESGWGMHLGNYFNSKYVTIHNYCKSGAWVQSIMSNEKDYNYKNGLSTPGWGKWGEMLNDANRSEGDYIIVSLGINDANNKTGEDENGNKISSVDWYGLGLEDMVKSAKEHGLNIIICTPMPTPGSGVNISDSEKNFSAKAKEIADKYGVPYLDMVTNIKEDYKIDLGYSEDMTEEEKAEINDQVYRKYYLVREELLKSVDKGGFGLSEADLEYHAQAASFKDPSSNYRNIHPNVRGADNMARWISKLLKDTDSDLRFYVR